MMTNSNAAKMPLSQAWAAAFRLQTVTRETRARTCDKFLGTELAPHNGVEPMVRVVRVIPQPRRRMPIIERLSEPLTFAQAEEFLRAYEVAA